MWLLNWLQRPPTGPSTRELALDAVSRVQLLEDRFEGNLDALKREAARVEAANRRAEGRSQLQAAPTNGHRSTWDIAREVNLARASEGAEPTG